MVNKAAIARNLRELDSRYRRKFRNPRDPLYYSKLALLELCGWIEDTMDKIVMDCARKHLVDAANLAHVETRIIRRTYGFDYEDNFRAMLMRVVGLVKLEDLEGMFDPTKFHLMKSSLGTLKQQRDQEAHSYIDSVTQTLIAPPVIINSHFPRVYDGLKDVERCVRRLKI